MRATAGKILTRLRENFLNVLSANQEILDVIKHQIHIQSAAD